MTIEARRSRRSARRAASAEDDERLSERAHQDRAIVYFLQPPETHAFDLYHDYTESRPGVDRYLNVVRKGSAASKPSARDPRHRRGAAGGDGRRGRPAQGRPRCRGGRRGDPGRSEVVVVHFARGAGRAARSRLRIAETYTDPKSYRLEGDELVFDRTFGRPRERRRPAGRLVADRELDPGHGLRDGRRPHPPRLRQSPATTRSRC